MKAQPPKVISVRVKVPSTIPHRVRARIIPSCSTPGDLKQDASVSVDGVPVNDAITQSVDFQCETPVQTTENVPKSMLKRTEKRALKYSESRPAASLFNKFVVDYGNLGFGDNDIDQEFMDKLDESHLMKVLEQAAPFGVVNTGPLGFNYFAIKSSGPNIPGWEIDNLNKNYEKEVMHGRWAMLAVSGCIVQEELGKGPWFTAGQVCTLNTCGSFKYGDIDFGIDRTWAGAEGSPGAFFTLYMVQIMLMWQVECYRTGINSFDGVRTKSKDGAMRTTEAGEVSTIFPEFSVRNIHPGGRFDPLKLGKFGAAVETEKGPYAFASISRLKAQELRHGRLAMLAWLAFIGQSIVTNLPLVWPPSTIDIIGANGPLKNLDVFLQNLTRCPINSSVGIPGCN